MKRLLVVWFVISAMVIMPASTKAQHISRNLPPVAVDDHEYIRTTCVVVDVLANDYDPEGGMLTNGGITFVKGGNARVTNDGQVEFCFGFGQARGIVSYVAADDHGQHGFAELYVTEI